MQQLPGNIWDFRQQGRLIVIPTNGFVKKNGEAVMGRGLAADFKNQFADFPLIFGTRMKAFGNHVFYHASHYVITFPTKHAWMQPANLDLIRQSAEELKTFCDTTGNGGIVLPRVGCGNGQLNWTDVGPILEKVLDNRFFVVYNGEDA